MENVEECLQYSVYFLNLQIRCISCLILPSFSSKSGKGILKAIAVTYVIAGPIQNMIYNGAEVVRTFACMGYLSSNISKSNYELMFKPFKDALFNMKVWSDLRYFYVFIFGKSCLQHEENCV